MGANLYSLIKLILPIKRDEWSLFLPVCIIFFLLTYTYDLLRIIKSSIVVAESSVGAEIIPFLKVWAVIPGAFILTGLALKLSHKFDREKVFYLMISFFISYFMLFILIIYPNREVFELQYLPQILQSILPKGAMGFISMVRHWHLALFYVITELWGSILLSMLFWGFANEVISFKQASRFYPLFLLSANSAAIFAGFTSSFFSAHKYSPAIPFGTTGWQQSLLFYLGTAIICGITIMSLFYLLHHYFDGKHKSEEQTSLLKDNHQKVKLSFRECLDCLLQSKYIMSIAILVVGYNLVFNITDVLWENQLKALYQDNAAKMAEYKSHITTMTGVFAVFVSLFVTGNLIRRCGWKYAAYATPVMIFSTGIVFFYFLLGGWQQVLPSIFLDFLGNPMHVTLFFGSIQACLSRGCKYTLFDTTKELAFIPLSTLEKRKAKAAIDGVGSRLGKSFGSILVQLLLIAFTSLQAATPFLAIFVCIILIVWLGAIYRLSLSHLSKV